MMTDIDYRIWLALMSVATTFGCAGLVLVVFQVRAVLREGRSQQSRYEGLRDKVLALADRSEALDSTHMELEKGLKRLGLRQDRLEMNRTEERPYSHAISMVKKGAGINDLVVACGLTRGEAELICMVHGMHSQSGKRTAAR